jgi:WD40 repeat protein
MTPRLLFGCVVLVGQWAATCFGAEARIPPRDRPLAIPIALETTAAIGAEVPALECLAGCGAAMPLAGIALSPDGTQLAVGGCREVLLWDLVEAKLSGRIGSGQIAGMVQTVAYCRSGAALAVGEGNPYTGGSVKVFDLPSGQVAMSFQEPKGVVYCLALSPNGKLLAAGSHDASAYVWNLEEKKLAATLKGHTLAVLSVGFSADGKFLVTGSADRAIQAWDTATWEPGLGKLVLEGPVCRCYHRAYEPNRKRHTFAFVVGGSHERSLHVRPDSNAQFWELGPKTLLSSGSPLDAVWKAKFDKAYVACSDKTVKVFSTTGQKTELTATLRGHADWVYAVALSADGKRLASASGDGTVKLWNTDDDNLLATLVQPAPGVDDWLIVAGQGYCTAAKAGAVQWRATQLKTTPEKLAALQNPDLVRQVLAGKKVPPPEL